MLVTKHYPLYKTYPLVSRTWQQPVTMTIMERRFSRKKTLMKKTLYLEVVIFKTKIILNLSTEGGSKEYEDDFFLNGPKMNISSLRNQMDIIKK